MHPLLELLCAVALDAIVGEPEWLTRCHPRRLIEKLIHFLEGLFREKMDFELRTAGALLSLIVLGVTALAASLLSGLGAPVGTVLRVALMYLALSPMGLTRRVMRVFRILRTHDLTRAREAISHLVTRDTDRLTEQETARAAVEYVGLNMSDAAIAPVLFMTIGSLFHWAAPMGWLFVAVSVLDAVLGHRTQEYVDLGWFAAKLDDLVGAIPARLTAYLAVGAAGLCRLNAPGALHVIDRDHSTQLSPNGGWGMAAIAGALGIQLGGDMRVNGVVLHKRTLGDNTRPPEAEDICRAVRMLWATYLLMLFVAALVLLIFC